jgi:hypothetical protein
LELLFFNKEGEKEIPNESVNATLVVLGIGTKFVEG